MNTVRVTWLLCLLWGLGMAPTLHAGGLLRCTNADGKTVLRNEPCHAGERGDQSEPAEEGIPLLAKGVRGQYWIPALVNGSVRVEFLIDTGANIVVMPQNIVDLLMAKGSVKAHDRLGSTVSQMADGSSARHPLIRLATLQIGQRVVKNVAVSVTPEGGLPLLGTPVLEQLGSWRIDQTRRQLVLPFVSPQPAIADRMALPGTAPAPAAEGPNVTVSTLSNHKVMRQCWRADGSSYLASRPCPAADAMENAATATGGESLVVQCRVLLTWVQSYATSRGRETRNDKQYRERIEDYNRNCPGLVIQTDSGRAEVLREIDPVPEAGKRPPEGTALPVSRKR